MRLRRLAAAAMAGIMTVSSAIVCQLPVSAEDYTLASIPGKYDSSWSNILVFENGDEFLDKLLEYDTFKIEFKLTEDGVATAESNLWLATQIFGMYFQDTATWGCSSDVAFGIENPYGGVNSTDPYTASVSTDDLLAMAKKQTGAATDAEAVAGCKAILRTAQMGGIVIESAYLTDPKVTTVEVTDVALDKSTLTLKVGDAPVQLTATVSPDDASDPTVTWTSDNEAVATVADGVVTAVSAGEATITATAGEKSASCVVTVEAPAVETDSFVFSYDGSPIDLTVTDASWTDSGLAAQKNAALDITGVTYQKTTFKELKDLYSGITLKDLAVNNVPDGVNADDIAIRIYIQAGSGWSWNAFDGTSVNFSDITAISDSDPIMEIGYQINYNIPAGASYKSGDTITINAKSDDIDEVFIGPSTRVQQVTVQTDENGNIIEQIAYFAISEADAKSCESFTVTITREKDSKKLVHEIKNCFKSVQYEIDGTAHKVTAEDGAYCILLDITNIGSDYGNLAIQIAPTK